jgi:hypothetical protein
MEKMGFLDSLGQSAFNLFGGIASGGFVPIVIILGAVGIFAILYFVLAMITEKKSWRMKLRIKKEVKGKRLEGFEFIPFRWEINPVTRKQTGLWELKEPKFFKSKIVPPCGKQVSNNTYAVIIDEFGNIWDDEGEVYDVSTGKTYGMKNFSGIGIAFDRQRKNNKVLGGNIRETNLGMIFGNIIKIICILGIIFLVFTMLKNDYNINQQSLAVTEKILNQQNDTAGMLKQFERKLDLNEQYNKFLFERLFGKAIMQEVNYNFQLYQANITNG